jgi:hypothetical protein
MQEVDVMDLDYAHHQNGGDNRENKQPAPNVSGLHCSAATLALERLVQQGPGKFFHRRCLDISRKGRIARSVYPLVRPKREPSVQGFTGLLGAMVLETWFLDVFSGIIGPANVVDLQ